MSLASRYSLATKLGVGQGVVIIAVMAVLTAVITAAVSRRVTGDAEQNLAQQTELLTSSMSSYQGALSDGAVKLGDLFRSGFPGSFEVDHSSTVRTGERETPVLLSGTTVLNGNTGIVDRFTKATRGVATVFVRSGDDFIRVATSLTKEDGSRALGTTLDRNHPAYRRLLNGEDFTGKTTLFNKDYMTRYLPLKNGQGRVIGTLFVGLDFTDGLKALKERFKGTVVGKSGYAFALEAKEGPDQGKMVIEPGNAAALPAEVGKSVRDMVLRKSGVTRYAAAGTGEERVLFFRYFPEWNWIVCIGAADEELHAVARVVRNTVVGSIAVVCLLLVGVSTLLVRRWVTRPVVRLLDGTARYAAGDFASVIEVAADGEEPVDEVERLTRGVDAMALSLRQILVRVADSASEVSAAAAQVSVSAGQIATGADEVVGKTAGVATAGEEMSATSNDIAQNCQMAVEEAQRATQSAHNGMEVVGRTVAVMDQIAAKVQESTATVASLGARSDQIGEIIGTIEDIADQTNLLALNAAIEAARAGEQGRGFAVVADEVRALAERTTRATQEIGVMIKAIQAETKDAVAVMDQGVQEVKAGTDEASRSGAALAGIRERIEAFTMQINQIATAAEEQTATTSEISQSLLQVTDVVQGTASSARESAVAAAQLNGTAQELQRLVDQFRLA
ncbi:MAG: HAMP domain-containing protein [Geobacter sp.]|nr:MAG: HAMP domain-containing protein [Geobacter sp.]